MAESVVEGLIVSFLMGKTCPTPMACISPINRFSGSLVLVLNQAWIRGRLEMMFDSGRARDEAPRLRASVAGWNFRVLDRVFILDLNAGIVGFSFCEKGITTV